MPVGVQRKPNFWCNEKVAEALFNHTGSLFLFTGVGVGLVTGNGLAVFVLFLLAVLESVMRFRFVSGKPVPFRSAYAKFITWENNKKYVFCAKVYQLVLVLGAFLFLIAK